MTYSNGTAARTRLGTATAGQLDNLDRILLGVCAAVWLVALGSAVAATVALVDLGTAHVRSEARSETPWLLYAVIAVSAVVIVGAVPLLLRARRTAQPDGAAAERPSGAAGAGGEAATEKMRALGPGKRAPYRPGYSTPPLRRPRLSGAAAAAAEQVQLRCVLVILTAMGVATLAVGVATYLMAADKSVASWSVYGVAGAATLAMIGAPWFYLRQLQEILDRP